MWYTYSMWQWNTVKKNWYKKYSKSIFNVIKGRQYLGSSDILSFGFHSLGDHTENTFWPFAFDEDWRLGLCR